MTNGKKEEEVQEEKSISIDLRELFKMDPKDLVPDISVVRYSNIAFINVTNRDVYIDFLEMPGIKKDGKVLLNGTRIYMPYAAAQKLTEVLQKTLEQVHSSGKMEMFTGKIEKEEKSS